MIEFDIYKNLLDESIPSIVYKKIKKKKKNGQYSINTEKLMIPPFNTDIRFDLPSFILKTKGLNAQQLNVPENFNWRITSTEDSEDILNKKKIFPTPLNQYLCGSCWAFAGVNVVEGNYVVSGIIKQKIDLSPTWVLSNYPQSQCKGGSPVKFFTDISMGGIVWKNCVDYSWCSLNEECNGTALKHFDSVGGHVDLSKYIPPSGCYFNTEQYMFTIDKNITTFTGSVGSEVTAVDKKSREIEIHIYNSGPVLGGFFVLENFMGGEFTSINGGVYLDRGNYNDIQDGKLTFNNSNAEPKQLKGGHAICIIGWGIEKNILTNDNEYNDVPYWYCMNSWGLNWGDGGYFKIAKYPWNKISQFDKKVILNSSKGNSEAGGIVCITVSQPPSIIKTKKIPNEGKLENDISFYKSDLVLQDKYPNGSSGEPKKIDDKPEGLPIVGPNPPPGGSNEGPHEKIDPSSGPVYNNRGKNVINIEKVDPTYSPIFYYFILILILIFIVVSYIIFKKYMDGPKDARGFAVDVSEGLEAIQVGQLSSRGPRIGWSENRPPFGFTPTIV